MARSVSCDALVVGAGPSGAATALHLARAGLRVTIVDGARFPRDKACGEGLLPAGVAALARLQLLEAGARAGARPLAGVTYTHPGRGPTAFVAFPPPPAGGAGHGLGVRRIRFDGMLAEALRREPGVTVIEGVRALGLLRADSGRVAGVATGAGPLEARMTVAADGLHSRLRAAAGWTAGGPARRSRRYGVAGHWAVATRSAPGIRVTLCGDHEWYEAPVGDDELLVSCLGPGPLIGRVARDYPGWARAALPNLGEATLLGRPLAAGAFAQHARRITGPGLALVGDAAGYDDPATGEGLAMGLLLAEALATELAALLHERASPATALARYTGAHRRLWRDRRRVLRLALGLSRHPRLSRRTVARAADDPSGLAALLAVNSGYRPLAGVRLREWRALAGL